MPKIPFTVEQIQALEQAILDAAILWEEPMSPRRLEQFIITLTVQNTTMSYGKMMRSIELARMQDRHFPMPSDILNRELR